MKLYYTIVHQCEGGSDLNRYFASRGIKCSMGADYYYKDASGNIIWKDISSNPENHLFFNYVVLIDEEELSFIKLTYPDIHVVSNMRSINLKNKIRSMFKWFL